MELVLLTRQTYFSSTLCYAYHFCELELLRSQCILKTVHAEKPARNRVAVMSVDANLCPVSKFAAYLNVRNVLTLNATTSHGSHDLTAPLYFGFSSGIYNSG